MGFDISPFLPTPWDNISKWEQTHLFTRHFHGYKKLSWKNVSMGVHGETTFLLDYVSLKDSGGKSTISLVDFPLLKPN